MTSRNQTSGDLRQDWNTVKEHQQSALSQPLTADMPPRRAAAAAAATAPKATSPKGKGKAKATGPPPPPLATLPSISTTTTTTTAPADLPLFFDGNYSSSSSPPSPTLPPHDRSDDDEALLSDASDASTSSDPVIKSYNIHLTSTLTPYLHLLQYPVRSSTLPYSRQTGACPSAARIKPASGVLELDIPINTSRHYDTEKGQRWGTALQKSREAASQKPSRGVGGGVGGSSGKRRKLESDSDSDDPDTHTHSPNAPVHLLTHQTLSSKIHPPTTKYMVGVFRQNELHLTPLHSTLQLRPQFHHIDTATSLEKDLQRQLRIDPSAPTAPPVARAVQATVKNTGEDGGGGGGDGALKALRREEGEEWVNMGWVDQDEEGAWEVFEGMFLPVPSSSPQETEGKKGEEGEKDDEGDVTMTGEKLGAEAGTVQDGEGEVRQVKVEEEVKIKKEKELAGSQVPKVQKLKTTISGMEYLQLLAAPRVEKD